MEVLCYSASNAVMELKYATDFYLGLSCMYYLHNIGYHATARLVLGYGI